MCQATLQLTPTSTVTCDLLTEHFRHMCEFMRHGEWVTIQWHTDERDPTTWATT